MKPSEVLRGMADKMAIGHAIGTQAKNHHGAMVAPTDPEACKWCIYGAANAVCPSNLVRGQALAFVRTVIDEECIAPWSDHHTQPEVVAALRKAAELAESEGM